MANKKYEKMSSNDRLDRIDELSEQADKMQKDSLVLQRKQTEEKNRLEEQQAHGNIADTVEDLGIQAGQALGLSPNTTTDYVMGAKDAAVNLFSSNEAIVEYYKNYDANRAKEEQKVNAVYSRELNQKQAAENTKDSKKSLGNTMEQNEVSRAEKRYQRAKEILNVPDTLPGMLSDMFSID